MAFPSTITTFSYPSPTDRLNNPSHSGLENTQSSAIGQIQAFIGTDSSAIGTLTYDIRSPLSNGGGHVQTANKGGTGQTTYTKGDILVAQSSSVLTKLAVGADGSNLTADSTQLTGVAWTGGSTNIQSFLSTGTWTKPSTGTSAYIEVWGGGGSGGAVQSGAGSAGGGGGGGYMSVVLPLSTLGATESVVIGAGGAPAVAQGVNGTAGTTGGATVFGLASLVTAYGGGGGPTSNGNTTAGGGGGGQLTAAVSSTAGLPAAPFNASGSVTGIITTLYGVNSGAGGYVLGSGVQGGNTMYGGAGGGATAAAQASVAGGISKSGGSGGKSSTLGVASMVSNLGSILAGAVPGGGGGGAMGINGSVLSGGGGAGMVRVTII